MSKVVDHARREFAILNKMTPEPITESDKLFATAYQNMQQNILAMLGVFSAGNYSGSFAPTALSMFNQLANFKPLTVLTGEDDEWVDCSDTQPGLFQNIRCNSVFKDTNKNEYFQVDVIAWFRKEEPNVYFTNGESCIKIDEFPYAPKDKMYLPYPETEDAEISVDA